MDAIRPKKNLTLKRIFFAELAHKTKLLLYIESNKKKKNILFFSFTLIEFKRNFLHSFQSVSQLTEQQSYITIQTTNTNIDQYGININE